MEIDVIPEPRAIWRFTGGGLAAAKGAYHYGAFSPGNKLLNRSRGWWWVGIIRKTQRDCYLTNIHHCGLQLNSGPHDFNTFIQIARQENPSVAADAQV